MKSAGDAADSEFFGTSTPIGAMPKIPEESPSTLGSAASSQ